MPFDARLTEYTMIAALELRRQGANYKRIRSWLIGRTTYHERNRILDDLFGTIVA